MYDFDSSFTSTNLSPTTILLRNDGFLVSNPRVHKSSLSEYFDRQVIEWFDEPKNVAILPKGFLKLTFYPN